MSDGEILHASTVEIAGKGVMIIGPSGSGKSSLALQLLALGAGLVSDDRTHVVKDGTALMARAPFAIRGQIEARGVGLIRVPEIGPTRLSLVVDLAQTETERLPRPHEYSVMGVPLPCLYNNVTPHFAAAIWLSVHGTLDRVL